MGLTLGLHRSLQRNSLQKVQLTYFHHLKKTSFNPKKLKMEAMRSFLGMRSSKSYSDSGQTQAELSKKASENPKEMSESEWHDLLDGQTFYVTREKGTERPWTSCLNDEKRKGTFICACCKQELFKSSAVIYCFLTASFAERFLK